jgi:hypothetical protein
MPVRAGAHGPLRVAFRSRPVATDLLDRNLYERANDCHWWALSPVLAGGLAQGDTAGMTRVLQDIHALYTVYRRRVVIDAHGAVPATSLAGDDGVLQGHSVPAAWLEAVRGLQGTQQYAVAAFAATTFSDGEHALSYLARVTDPGSGALLGGVAVVFDAAFTGIGQVLSNTISLADHSMVNVATDGEPNRCGGAGTTVTSPGATASHACAVAARDALIALGVDNIGIEGIGVTPANATFLQNSICYPGPCDTTVPFSNFPNEGFYIGVANAEQYAQAIRNKILVVTQQEVPAPGTVALVGLALLALGASTRQRAGAR